MARVREIRLTENGIRWVREGKRERDTDKLSADQGTDGAMKEVKKCEQTSDEETK